MKWADLNCRKGEMEGFKTNLAYRSSTDDFLPPLPLKSCYLPANWLAIIMCSSRKSPYPPHGRSLEISKGRGGLKVKILEAKYEAKLEFPRGSGRGAKQKPPIGGVSCLWVENFDLLSTHANVPVKLKLQHPPPPRAYPGHLTPLPSQAFPGGREFDNNSLPGVGNLMGRRGKWEKIVKRRRGLGGRQGVGEGREPVDKGLQPPFCPLVIDLSLSSTCHYLR